MQQYTIQVDSYVINKPFKTWEKFASYLKDDEIIFLERIKSSDITTLSVSDLEKYNKIKNQIEVSKLIGKYSNQSCTNEEHDLVYNFVNKSLNDFMEDRMSEEEKVNARLFASSLKTKEELENYINDKESKYDELSAYEAYELYVVKTRHYAITTCENNEKNRIETLQRERNLRRKLISDYGVIF